MKALIVFTGLIVFGTMATHAQTTKEKLEKVKADPKNKERAAKADVYIVKKTAVIVDSGAVKNSAANSGKKKKKQ